jgi:hypothetical protein
MIEFEKQISEALRNGVSPEDLAKQFSEALNKADSKSSLDKVKEKLDSGKLTNEDIVDLAVFVNCAGWSKEKIDLYKQCVKACLESSVKAVNGVSWDSIWRDLWRSF